MKHAHADLLHRLAEDCDLAVWFWFDARQEWLTYTAASIMADTCGQYQFALGDKPTSPPKRYAMVEGVRVPMTHLMVGPVYETRFWYANANGIACWERWVGTIGDRDKLAALNCYATEADAQEAATAWAQVRKNAAERAQ